MSTIVMKAPAAMASSTTIILQDGTTTTIDAFGYITIDSKYVGGCESMGFITVLNPVDTIAVNKFTAMTDTTAATILAASLVAENAVINMTGTQGAGTTLTLPTVAQLVAAIPEWVVGMTMKLRVIHTGAGNFAWTLTTATTWTMTGTQTVAQNTWRDFLITFQSGVTGTVQSIGTGAQS